ncbi:MAG: sodium/glutamate symporter, partial [Candidatus Woesearchaeota archaeon]
KKIWKLSGPMISFGMIIAWGHYVLGLLLAMFILTPVFGANPLVASLIEISFQGGHGTVAGLATTFEQLGWPEGTDIGYAIATLSIVVAIVSGIFFINIFHRKTHTKLHAKIYEKQKEAMIRNGYDLTRLSHKLENNPEKLLIHIGLFGIAISLGWFILQSLIFLENLLLVNITALRFFMYLPLFPLAMIGGLLVQLFLKKMNRQNLVDAKIVHNFSTIALDFLIASAIATVSLNVIGDNFMVFLILSVTGILWIFSCFFIFAPLIFKKDWFINGITNVGQAMGVTATGLLLNRLVDPSNRSKAREIFGYKQLFFEMFMGGGIVTAVSAVMIFQLGSFVALMISLVAFTFWLIVGIVISKKNHHHLH